MQQFEKVEIFKQKINKLMIKHGVDATFPDIDTKNDLNSSITGDTFRDYIESLCKRKTNI